MKKIDQRSVHVSAGQGAGVVFNESFGTERDNHAKQTRRNSRVQRNGHRRRLLLALSLLLMPKELTDLNTDSTHVNASLSTHASFVQHRTGLDRYNEFTSHISALLTRHAVSAGRCVRRSSKERRSLTKNCDDELLFDRLSSRLSLTLHGMLSWILIDSLNLSCGAKHTESSHR